MATPTSSKAIPIKTFKVLGTTGAVAITRRLQEKDTQSFKIGTPVMVEVSSGYLIANPTIHDVATAVIAGFAQEPGHSLTTSAVPKTLTYGSVQNQPSAVLIPVGAPPSDGLCGVDIAMDEMIFQGVLGDSTDNPSGVVAQTDLGAIFGLTIDPGNAYWYVDKAKTSAATGACVEITDFIDPVGTVNGKVGFKITHAAQQMSL
jgi:hypothetical protein